MPIFNFRRKKNKEKTNPNDLDPRIVKKKIEIADIINQSVLDNRYSVYSFDVSKDILRRCEEQNSFEKYEWFFDVIGQNDKRCTLSQDTGEMINRLMSDPDNYLAIHMGHLGRVEDVDGMPYIEKLDDILHNGLIDYAAELDGMHTDYPSPSQTTARLMSFGDLPNLFSSYKDNNVAVLLQFPKSLVDDSLYVDKEHYFDIFREVDKKKIIKPEYIIGAIIKEGTDTRYYSKEELLSVKRDKKEY